MGCRTTNPADTMHEGYSVHQDGTTWYTPIESDDKGTTAPRPTAHILAAEGVSTADLLEVVEENIDGSGGAIDLGRFLVTENDTLGFLTLRLPTTSLGEADLMLERLEAVDEVASAEYQRTYTLPEEQTADVSVYDTARRMFNSLKSRISRAVNDLFGLFDEPDESEVTADTPNDPLVSDQYGVQQMNTFEAHDALPDNDAEVSAWVIDSGTDPEHEDLKGQIPASAGEDFSDGEGGDTDPTYPDTRGGDHGVHVGGTVAATNGNGVGIAGVAGLPNVTLQTVKIFGADPRTLGETVAEAIQYAVDEGADVINMSIGGTGRFGFPSDVVERAIEYATENDCLCVAASGNAGKEEVDFPARHPLVVGVGAVDENENPARFSNRGDGVDVAAAGVRVTSTLPNNEYGDKSGTSMASPHVAGAIALGFLAKPDATASEIRDTLKATARSVSGADADDVGAGIPDLKAFVNALRE